jgi:hypothetical protein
MDADLEPMLDAAKAGDWLLAVKSARLIGSRSVASLVAHSDIAVRTSWVSLYAPYSLTTEITRIFASDLREGLREEDVAAAFSGALFEAAAKAFRIAVGTAPSRAAGDAATIMLHLPGASRAREARLRTLFVDAVDHVVSAQSLAIGRPVSMDCGTARRLLSLPPELHAAIAQADLYPGVSLEFLTTFLRVAQLPALRRWTHEHMLTAWPDLMEIVATRTLRRDLSPDAGDWIRRVTQLDPEESAPGEYADEE